MFHIYKNSPELKKIKFSLLNYYELFYFNKYLFSFFNCFCKNGKKGITLKLIELILINLKHKTMISPVIILKSILINFKQFFKINVTKYRRRNHYSITYLSLNNQLKHSIRNLVSYFNSINDLNRFSNLVDKLTYFFLSFFFKSKNFYNRYLDSFIQNQKKLKEIVSNAKDYLNRDKHKRNKKNKKKKKNTSIYIKRLLKPKPIYKANRNKVKPMTSSKIYTNEFNHLSVRELPLTLEQQYEDIYNKKLIKFKSEYYEEQSKKSKVKKKNTKNKKINHKNNKKDINNSYTKHDNTNFISRNNKLSQYINNEQYLIKDQYLKIKEDIYEEDFLGYTSDISNKFNDIKLSNITLNFFNKKNSLKNKLIFFFFKKKFKKIYFLSESLYSSIFQSTFYYFYDYIDEINFDNKLALANEHTDIDKKNSYNKKINISNISNELVTKELSEEELSEEELAEKKLKKEIEDEKIYLSIKYFIKWFTYIYFNIDMNKRIVNDIFNLKSVFLDKNFINSFFNYCYDIFMNNNKILSELPFKNKKLLSNTYSNKKINSNFKLNYYLKKRLFNFFDPIVIKKRAYFKYLKDKKEMIEKELNKKKLKYLLDRIRHDLKLYFFSNITRNLNILISSIIKKFNNKLKNVFFKKRKEYKNYKMRHRFSIKYLN